MNTPPPPPPRPVATLRHHTAALSTIGFARGTRLLLSGDCDGGAAVWQLSRRRVLAEWAPHLGSAVLKVQELGSSSGTVAPKLLSQGRDGLVRIWDTSRLDLDPRRASASQTGKEGSKMMAALDISTGSYSFCKCATLRWPSSPSLSPQASSGTVPVVDEPPDTAGGGGVPSTSVPGDGEPMSRYYTDILAGGSGPLRADQWVVTPCSDAPTAQLWDVRGKRHALTLSPSGILASEGPSPPKTGMLMCLALVDPSNAAGGLGKNPIVVGGYESGHVSVFDLVAGKMRGVQKLHGEPILALDIDRQGTQIVTGAADTTVWVSSISREEESSTPDDADSSEIFHESPAGGYDLSSPPVTEVARPVARSGLGASLAAAEESTTSNASGASRTETSRRKSGEGRGGEATYKIETSGSITIDKAGVEALALRGDHGMVENDPGGIFACAGWDRRIRIFEWSAPQRPLALMKQHTAGICSMTWSDDGTFLASAAKDGNISLWSMFPPTTKPPPP